MPCLWRKAYLLLAFSALEASANNFLGDALIRHNQVQDVLEHESARGEPLCQHSVRKWLYSMVPIHYVFPSTRQSVR